MRGRSQRIFNAPGLAVEPWHLLTSTDQGVSPFDPGGFTTTGTVFDPATGLFTWKMLGDTTVINGYRENQARWTRGITDLYPDFSPATDVIDLAMEPAIPLLPLGTERYGLAFGILDATTAGIAGANGRQFAIWPSSSTVHSQGGVQDITFSPTNPISGGGGTTAELCIARFFAFGDNELNAAWKIRNNTDVWVTGVAVTPLPISATAANWRIHVGSVHNNNVTGAPTMTAKIYHRRTRTTGLALLPT